MIPFLHKLNRSVTSFSSFGSIYTYKDEYSSPFTNESVSSWRDYEYNKYRRTDEATDNTSIE